MLLTVLKSDVMARFRRSYRSSRGRGFSRRRSSFRRGSRRMRSYRLSRGGIRL